LQEEASRWVCADEVSRLLERDALTEIDFCHDVLSDTLIFLTFVRRHPKFFDELSYTGD
jgi:hypothetical protein